MENISLKGTPVTLKVNKYYYFIDSLFIMDIKEELNNFDALNLDIELRNKVFAFPCTDIPFAKYKSNSHQFTIDRIKKIKYNSIPRKDDSYFACDSGLLIIIATEILIDFAKKFSYEIMVDSESDIIDLKYWHSLTYQYEFDDIAIIASPGVNSGFDFEGSGTYQVT